MRSAKIALTTGLVFLFLSQFATAQLLKKLEQRLGNIVDKAGQPQPTAEGQLPPPAGAGYLGLVADETDGQQGIVVLTTRPGSPAEAAGVKKDDVVTAINGQAVRNLNDFQHVMDQIAAGQKAQLTVRRGEQSLTLSATLVARQTPPVNRAEPEDPGAPPSPVPPNDPFAPGVPSRPAGNPPGEAVSSRASLGISVVPLTEQSRATYGLQATRGALIASVKPGGPADRAGLPVGGLIVAIDGTRIDSPDQVVDLVAAARPGQEMEVNYYRGNTLSRKTVRLGSATFDANARPAGVAPAAPPAIGGVIGGGAGDRPIVRRIGEVVDQLARPAGGTPAGQMEEINALKSQVELLQATVRSLEERLLRLENKAGIGKPEEAAEPQAPQGNDALRKLELQLTPPEQPPLPAAPPAP
jgi:membrane-associated protease RseP (regulator of RpoE activity)